MPERGFAETIAAKFAGRSLLITGGAGFLGKAVIEKLLRSAPDIARCYLLVRGSRRESALQRVANEVLRSSIFDSQRRERGSAVFETYFWDKFYPLEGDLCEVEFGLSGDEYERLTRDVNGVIHCAASVSFREQLGKAIAINTLAPRRVLQFAHHCGDIPMVHVSTCYVSGKREGSIAEEVLPLGHTPKTFAAGAEPTFDIDQNIADLCIRCLDEEERIERGDRDSWIENVAAIAQDRAKLEKARETLLDRRLRKLGHEVANVNGWADVYTFTKCLGEQILARDRGETPLVIVRPAIVESTWEQPTRGWIDGLKMTDPLILAYGSGRLKSFCGQGKSRLDIIPCDFVANAILAAFPATNAPTLEVYQVASSSRNPCRVDRLTAAIESVYTEQPMRDRNGRPIRVERLKLVDREPFLRSCTRLQTGLGVLQRGTDAVRLRKLSRWMNGRRNDVASVAEFAEIYGFYASYDPCFETDNLDRLRSSLTPDDQQEFPFDVRAIDWDEYLCNRHIPGLRIAADDSAVADAPGAAPVENIYTFFERSAERFREKIAVQSFREESEGDWQAYSYRQMTEAAAWIHAQIEPLGIKPGERAVLYGASGPEWGLAYLAIQRAGLTAVPLDPQLRADQVADIVRFTDARVVFVGKGVDADCQRLTERLEPVRVLALEAPLVPTPAFLSQLNRFEAPAPKLAHPDEPASIIFTSGTLLSPKGVVLTHRNFLSNVRDLLDATPFRADDRWLSVLPMYHALEFTGGFLVPMSTGATITYLDRLNLPRMLAAMQSVRPTHLLCVPRLLQLIAAGIRRKVAEKGRIAQSVFSALRIASRLTGGLLGKKCFAKIHQQFGGSFRNICSGGSPLDPEVAQLLIDVGFPLGSGYGLTETSPVLTVAHGANYRVGSAGRILKNVELRVDRPLRDGIGEIVARGPSVMRGYFQAEDKTREAFEDGWFKTGDMGRIDRHGNLHIVGRMKDVIVTAAGKNVYPDEVEHHYSQAANIAEFCILGVTTTAGEEVHAVVVAAEVADQSSSAVEAAIRAEFAAIAVNIPTYARVQHIHFYDKPLPRTHTLKIKRAQLQLEFNEVMRRQPRPAAETFAGELTIAPIVPTSALTQVRQILAAQLPPGRTAQEIQPDDFLQMDLGVDSMGLQELVAGIEDRFAIGIRAEEAAAWRQVKDALQAIESKAPLLAGEPKSRETSVIRPSAEKRLAVPQIPPLRWAVRGLAGLFARLYFRIECEGLELLPANGSFVLAPNHNSHLDTLAVLLAIGDQRKMHVAIAADYFLANWRRRWMVAHAFHPIPLQRNDKKGDGLRRCLRVLSATDANNGLLIYPEGTRSRTGQLQPLKPGIGLLAVEASVPVVPVWIEGTAALLPKGKSFPSTGRIRLKFGAPVSAADVDLSVCTTRQEKYRAFTDQFDRELRLLGGLPVPTLSRQPTAPVERQPQEISMADIELEAAEAPIESVQ